MKEHVKEIRTRAWQHLLSVILGTGVVLALCCLVLAQCCQGFNGLSELERKQLLLCCVVTIGMPTTIAITLILLKPVLEPFLLSDKHKRLERKVNNHPFLFAYFVGLPLFSFGFFAARNLYPRSEERRVGKECRSRS